MPGGVEEEYVKGNKTVKDSLGNRKGYVLLTGAPRKGPKTKTLKGQAFGKTDSGTKGRGRGQKKDCQDRVIVRNTKNVKLFSPGAHRKGRETKTEKERVANGTKLEPHSSALFK